ncbi:transporter [Psychromonas sp. PRT-SC03]|nr:transporter [Psychromonas sp. PRT-SC03]
MKIYLKIILSFAVAMQLQGCAGGVIIAAGTAAYISSDERSLTSQFDDGKISSEALDAVNKLNIPRGNLRINFITNSGYLLVLGQVKSAQAKDDISLKLSKIKGVKEVYNQLRIKQPIDFTQQSKDAWITTKVKSEFTGDKQVNPLKIKVITEDGEVFLVAKIDRQMAKYATNIARNIDGVKKVNRVFQLYDVEKK